MVVEQIHATKHVYLPRKHPKVAPLLSQGWPQRCLHYRWKSGKSNGAEIDPHQLANSFTPIAQTLATTRELSVDDLERAQNLARLTFIWGGVFKGKKTEATGREVASVIHSALTWSDSGAAMDAGWTKVAAFATSWLEHAERAPQVIYDSRVAAALIRNVDRIFATHPVPKEIQAIVVNDLQMMPSRHPHRYDGISAAWRQRTSKPWNAQFFGSLFATLVRDVLNSAPGRYGLPEDAGRWTIRSVEKVLFMDGY
jgi:hypothetical protein